MSRPAFHGRNGLTGLVFFETKRRLTRKYTLIASRSNEVPYMTKRILLSFATVALAIATAGSSHRITLFQPSLVNGTELKPGDYKVEVKDNKAVITRGKTSIEAPVMVETADTEFNSTSVRYANGDGKYRLQEIEFGGTNTKLVFSN
jgi:hypothetical protein